MLFSPHLSDLFVPDMASSNKQAQNWLMLSHPGIFEKIMLMIGHDSLESLDICRQVCRSWNAMILNNIWENPTKRWATIIQRRIERSWNDQNYYPSDKLISRAILLGKHRMTIILIDQLCIILATRGILTLDVFESLAERVRENIMKKSYIRSTSNVSLSRVTCTASLVHHGLWTSVKRLWLCDVDLTSVPAEHLVSLVSSVTGQILISNLNGFDLVNILDGVKTKGFGIKCQSLCSEQTKALDKLHLDDEVTLDIRVLIECNGQEKCMIVWCYDDDAHKYKEQMRTWATSRNWEVTYDDDCQFWAPKGAQ